MKCSKITGFTLAFVVSVCCFLSCNEEHGSKDKVDIDVTLCGQKNPDWLQEEVFNATKKAYGPTEIYIYALTSEPVDYIALQTQRMLSSRYPDYIQFYNCSGKEIVEDTGDYNFLLEAFMQKRFALEWKKYMD